jgi:hypothetical protein
VLDSITGNTVILLCVGFALTAALYLLSLWVTSGLQCAPSAFNVPAQLREVIGMLVRRLRKLPSVPAQVDAVLWFKLNLDTATDDDVEWAADTLFGALFDSHFWAYPASQQRLLKRHMRKARAALAFHADSAYQARTASVRERRRVERAAAHRATQQGTAPGPEQNRRGAKAAPAPRPAISGWRRVLGLQAAEVNADVIKKAYRKRVSAVHPDRGGSTEQAAEVNDAFAEARQELTFV